MNITVNAAQAPLALLAQMLLLRCREVDDTRSWSFGDQCGTEAVVVALNPLHVRRFEAILEEGSTAGSTAESPVVSALRVALAEAQAEAASLREFISTVMPTE